MKIYTVCFLLIINCNACLAEVYKCTRPSGKIYYQDSACPPGTQNNSLNIIKTDPAIIDKAQQKLSEEIAEMQRKEKQEKAQALEERKIQALENNAQANQQRAEAARQQAEIQNQQINRQNSNTFYFLPYKNPPNLKPKYNYPHPNQDTSKYSKTLPSERKPKNYRKNQN